MKSLAGFLKSTLIGGLVFLLPIGIVLIVLGKLYGLARRIGNALHDHFFPTANSDLLPLAIALLVLVAIAFAAGALARTRFGARIFTRLETTILANFPAYTMLRQTVADISGGSAALTGPERIVVLVRFDDSTALGFLVDRRPDGTAVVYLPGAPSALSGSVVLVESARIEETAIKATEVMQGMRRLGAGLSTLGLR